MNIRLIKLLALACGILMAVIVAEWQYARFAKKQLLSQNAPENGQPYIAGELPKMEVHLKPEESYIDLTTRPLFIEGRRPIPEEAGEIEEVVVPMEKFDWALDGIYLHKDVAMALFSRTQKTVNKGKHLKKMQGEVIEGWTLLSIEPDKVILEQNGKRHELLLRKPKPTKLPPQAQQKPKPSPATPASAPAPVVTPNPFLLKSQQ